MITIACIMVSSFHLYLLYTVTSNTDESRQFDSGLGPHPGHAHKGLVMYGLYNAAEGAKVIRPERG